ncbi:MAG: acyl-CoA thioesterase [Candidatus Margulisbacteria bacterium]|jgi:acyl-CoA thioester hydrolase|nr:acyl-CoA thioesterase [Candidatus Margulisiibacteriota bacterium]
MIAQEIQRTVAFYDVDSMGIMWHGNYIKLLEEARCALLSELGYNYIDMQNSGYAWPVVTLKIKYVKPAVFEQQLRIRAELLEYEHRLKIKYLIRDASTGAKISVAETVQMAIAMETRQTLFTSPSALSDKVKAYQAGRNV